jgi:hypothetical protein
MSVIASSTDAEAGQGLPEARVDSRDAYGQRSCSIGNPFIAFQGWLRGRHAYEALCARAFPAA